MGIRRTRENCSAPLVSVVLTTRDRPRLLPIALTCYRHQTYANRELIVVDDGDAYPADEQAVTIAGGRLLRVAPGTPLGAKLNAGVDAARGSLCQKMDDDDWYAPHFLETMTSALMASWADACRPTVAFLSPFLLFDLARWEVRRSVDDNLPGATLLFTRDDWAERPFRALPGDEDLWFLLDQCRIGASPLKVKGLDTFVAVRHGGAGRDRGHTWTHQATGQPLEEYLRHRPLHPGGPERLLPEWGLAVYRELRGQIVAPTPPLSRFRSWRDRLRPARHGRPASDRPRVLILTPVKDAADCLDRYCERLARLTYPHHLVSLGFLESDSLDGTYADLQARLPALRQRFRRVGVWQRDFGYRLPPDVHRGAAPIQIERRTVLAKSRNHLLFHALDDEEWVLWLDVDVIDYPPDLIDRLLATGKAIVQPHCVLDHGGPTFDRNGWRDHGRFHLDDLRDEGELVELDAVGGTVLLVRADLHRDGLIFPSFLYGRQNSRIRPGRGELETEGLGIMARDMGHTCWGMPHLEVIHRKQ